MNRKDEILDNLKDTFEMANLKSYRSGMRYDIWLDSEGSERKIRHNNPRVKVRVPGTPGIPIILYPDGHAEVDKKSKDFAHSKEFIKWVEDNKDTIIRHWNDEIDDLEALQTLSK